MENNNEIGSFLELSYPTGHEYYHCDNIARLNSGRAAIYHAVQVLNCQTICMPYYQCGSVSDFLKKKGIKIKFYYIDWDFNPVIESNSTDMAMLLVNYFGIMGQTRMHQLASKYKNVIIDNSQAFFASPIDNCMNIYSLRKFMGVPDGAYVIGNDVHKYLDGYQQDYSSDTSLFLLQRIEYGCEGRAYESRKDNEKRIDDSDIKKMSRLTRRIADGIDYEYIKQKRQDNFKFACTLFDGINRINPKIYISHDCVPMVYPLVVEDENMLEKLIDHKIFQGHWWNYLINVVKPTSFEYYLSMYLIPITIDQRYGKDELKYVFNMIGKDFSES